jgi:hypothetical protein
VVTLKKSSIFEIGKTMVKIEIEGRLASCSIITEIKWSCGRRVFLTSDSPSDWKRVRGLGAEAPELGHILVTFSPEEALIIHPSSLRCLLGSDKSKLLKPLFDDYTRLYGAGKVKDYT